MLLSERAFRNLCRGRELLSDFPPDAATVVAIARQAGISPFHFIRQFEAVFGVTPHQYRIQNRLDCARRLLARGDYSVTEVCFEAGFSSLGSFSHLFHSRHGLSPSEYRKRARLLLRPPGYLPEELFPGCYTLMGRLPDYAFRRTPQMPF